MTGAAPATASKAITITKTKRKKAALAKGAKAPVAKKVGKRVAVHVATMIDPDTKQERKLFTYMLEKTANYFGFPSSGVMASDLDKNKNPYWWRPSKANAVRVPKAVVKSTAAGVPDKYRYASIPMPREMRIEDIARFLATATKNQPNSFAVKSGRHYSVDATPGK